MKFLYKNRLVNVLDKDIHGQLTEFWIEAAYWDDTHKLLTEDEIVELEKLDDVIRYADELAFERYHTNYARFEYD